MDKSLRRNLPLCLCKRRVWCGLESPEIPARLNALNAACADGLHDDGAQGGTARIHRKAKEEYSKSLGFELQEGLRNQASDRNQLSDGQNPSTIHGNSNT